MVLLTGGQKKGKRDRFIKFKYSSDFLFSFFFLSSKRREGDYAEPVLGNAIFLTGTKGARLVTSKLLPLHRDASKSHPRPRETRGNKMAPGSRANCYLKSVPASRAMITSLPRFSPMSAPTMARDIYSAFV